MRSSRIASIAAVSMLGVALVAVAEEKKPEAWGGVVVGKLTLTAVVQNVDPATRKVTVEDDKGVTRTVVCGPLVRNFAQIQKGDKVLLRYTQALAIEVTAK